MALAPARTQKLPVSTEMSLAVGSHLLATRSHPDTTTAFDLGAWPLAPRPSMGFFATSVAPLPDGRALAVGRHGHPNPYRLYELACATGAVQARPVTAPWPDLRAVHAVGDRVLLVPGGSLDVAGRQPAWWDDGALTPLDLPVPEAPAIITHEGAQYAGSRRLDGVDVAALAGDEALLIWFERLYRVRAAGVVPLATDHLAAAWEPLREGRYAGLDAQGRARMVVNRRFVAVDREGAWAHVCPGAEAITAAAPGPDGAWLLVGDETLVVMLPAEQAVVEVDLRAMRLAPKMALFMPKAVWVPSREAILVTHAHDAWEFDLAAVLREKRVSMDKHAAALVAARRAAWKRKMKSAGAPVALDALSPHTRGGGAVTHPAWGDGAVLHASELRHRGAQTITASVLFEDRTRQFNYVGAGWVERPWTVA
ncbi:MAG: hypothetical protein U0325_16125 [Polyangiales bacterium]